MAEYECPAGDVGIYGKKLAGEEVDTVTLADFEEDVEVRSDGAAAIYFTIDGSEPTVEGTNCYELPAIASVRTIDRSGFSVGPTTTVKLISAGTPEYAVSKRP